MSLTIHDERILLQQRESERLTQKPRSEMTEGELAKEAYCTWAQGGIEAIEMPDATPQPGDGNPRCGACGGPTLLFGVGLWRCGACEAMTTLEQVVRAKRKPRSEMSCAEILGIGPPRNVAEPEAVVPDSSKYTWTDESDSEWTVTDDDHDASEQDFLFDDNMASASVRREMVRMGQRIKELEAQLAEAEYERLDSLEELP